MLYKPEFKISYRGKSTYTVGKDINGLGAPLIEVCCHLYQTDLASLNFPESFWTTELAKVGTVSWESMSVPFDGCRHQFPPEAIVREFSQYVAGRYSEDYETFEVENPPVLVATRTGFEVRNKLEIAIAAGHITRTPVLWQGTAQEMSKELWFSKIFPYLYPTDRVNFEVRLSRLRKPIQYFGSVYGWTENPLFATKFYREQDAKDALDKALQAIAPGNDEEKG